MEDLLKTAKPRSPRAEAIQASAIQVFGRFGFKKTSMEDLAAAAGLSKQGLYLHFSSKEELFVSCMQQYLDGGLSLVDRALSQSSTTLTERLVGAMDAWFGRHLATFSAGSLDVIEAGNSLSGQSVESYKSAFRDRIATALSQSPDFSSALSADELAHVLYTFGLAWKEEQRSRAEFLADMRLCVRACIPATPASKVDRKAKTQTKSRNTR